MKHISKKSCVCAAFTAGLLLFYLADSGYCADNTALMLDVSPSEGGTVNLSSGVHVYDRDSEVTLKAAPRSGFQFVCWLGDVTDAKASSTSVYLDTPKIVVAVFERSEFTFDKFEEAPEGSAGGGALIPSQVEQASNGTGQGGRKRQSFHFPQPLTPTTPNQDVPVPQDNEGDVPVPVPEPATVTLMLAGVLALIKRSRGQAKVHHQDVII